MRVIWMWSVQVNCAQRGASSQYLTVCLSRCVCLSICQHVSICLCLYTVEVEESDLDVVGASELRPARGKRPIFDCYWNGRLIPYSTIDEYVVYFLTVVVIAFVFIILHSAQYNWLFGYWHNALCQCQCQRHL